MARGYVGNISTEKDSQGFRTLIHVDFASKKESAGFWTTRQAAKDDAAVLEHHDIAITTAVGERHVCKGYHVEQRAPEEFVIWCEAPFVQRITGTDQPNVPVGGLLK